ncbi:MAG TPA: hypothetical protein VM450_11640 [Thermomicrobiales bacterium]|nr:hypothetical protein [Thermomicrobiales bacterium]
MRRRSGVSAVRKRAARCLLLAGCMALALVRQRMAGQGRATWEASLLEWAEP